MHTHKTHAVNTKGHWYGHVFRRIIHVSMLAIPLVYYAFAANIAGFFALSTHSFLLILLALALLVELIRLRMGLIFFGQRKHEAKYISSFSWGLFGIVIVLLTSPSRAFSIPIIWCLALVDPLLGELRRIRWPALWTESIGLISLLAIWWLCGSYWLGISMWWGVLLAPITLAVEWLNLKWVDDNALMLLVPLGFVLAIEYFMLNSG